MSDVATASIPAAPAVPRSPASITARTALLALGLLAAMVAGDALAGALVPSVGAALAARQPEGAASGGAIALVALLHALVLAPVGLRARFGGWRLALAAGGAHWLIVWVLNQIEAVVYIGALLPEGFLRSTAISQGVVAIAAGALVAALLGPRPEAPARRHAPLLDSRVPLHAWGPRLIAISLIYVLLYFLAGIFIAWRNPELQAFYEPIGVPSAGVVVGLQLGRGLLWAAAAGLLLWALDAGRRAAAVTVALVFAVLMASALIPANPLMPPEVRTTHFIEIASSNFLFGLATAWILTRRARGR